MTPRTTSHPLIRKSRLLEAGKVRRGASRPAAKLGPGIRDRVALAQRALNHLLASPDEVDELLRLVAEMLRGACRVLDDAKLWASSATIDDQESRFADVPPFVRLQDVLLPWAIRGVPALARVLVQIRRLITASDRTCRSDVRLRVELLLAVLDTQREQQAEGASKFRSGHAAAYQIALLLVPVLRLRPKDLSSAGSVLAELAHRDPRSSPCWELTVLDQMSAERAAILDKIAGHPAPVLESASTCVAPLSMYEQDILKKLQGTCDLPSQEQLARALHVGRSTVQRGIAELTRLGLVRRPRGQRSGYEITAAGRSWLFESARLTDSAPDTAAAGRC